MKCVGSIFYLLLTVIVLVSSISCTSKEDTLKRAQAKTLLQVSQLQNRCGVIPLSVEAQTYLSKIAQKLSEALLEGRFHRQTFNFRLLGCEEPIAFSTPQAEIYLSLGIIQRLSNEAEFAFLSAHEFAHLVLGHYETAFSSEISLETRQELEFEADSLALGLIALAHYDIHSSLTALARLHYISPTSPTPTHPAAQDRTQRLKAAIDESAWNPPGIQNHRAFRQFQRLVLQAKK